MANEVQKFDPSTLMDGVKMRIRAEFASMIPDEAWTQMIQKEVDFYFHSPTESNYNRDRTTRFQDLIRTLLQEEIKKRFADYLTTEGFTKVWANQGYTACGEAVKKIIIDNSGEILVSFFGGMFTGMLENFKSQLNNNRY